MKTSTLDLRNMDCMELMKEYPDGYFELAIVDPPYRDNNQPTKDMRKNGQMKTIKGRPKKAYWQELFRISQNQIIWGANNFQLPQFKGFVVWKKLTISEKFTMSMAEIASLSEGLSTVSKIVEFMPQGTIKNPRIHPNQKPVALYRWLLENYAKPGDKILETHLGSGSIAIACHELGFDLVASELDPDYYNDMLNRVNKAISQTNLFTKSELKTTTKQTELF